MPHAQPLYQAVAHIVGRYYPGPNNHVKGELVTEDGGRYPAKLIRRVSYTLQKQFPELSIKELLERTWIWKVYPRTLPQLVFSLVKARPVPENYPNIEVFKISGEVDSIWFEEEDLVDVTIRHNEPKQDPSGTPDPFRLRLHLYGSVPARALGKIWRFEAQRQGDRLVILSGMKAPVPGSPSNTEPQVSGSKAEDSAAIVHPVAPEPSLPAVPSVSQPEEPLQAVPALASSANATVHSAKQTAKDKPQPEPGRREVPVASTPVNQVASTSTQAKKKAASQPKSSSKPTSAIATGKAEKSNLAKSAGSSAGKTTEAKRQALFKVTANHRQFPGCESVSLKNRVLVIDGKVAAQTLVAIVEGTVKRIEADGTKQVGNQIILTSR